MNVWVEILGSFAGVCTSFAFFPQIMKLFKYKQSLGLSKLMYGFTCLGCFMWLFYGIVYQSFALIFFNSLNVVSTLIILFLSYRYS